MKQQSFDKGATKLFNEALTYYIQKQHQQSLLTRDDTNLMLLAIHGLTSLNAYPLAKALMRLTFNYLTAEDYLTYLEQGRRQQRSVESEIPF